ncbi:MAG: hypothetical protein MZU91_03050 [Desulfosudis oleivorans]|nr:hypothetical protein [Desulfosudis oleivorans]
MQGTGRGHCDPGAADTIAEPWREDPPGKVYWSVAFPYKMGEQSNKSLSLMNEAIRETAGRPGAGAAPAGVLFHAYPGAGLPAKASSTMQSG